MWHCDITTFYVSFFDYDIFLFPIMTSVKEKNALFSFLGWYFGFNLFYIWFSFYTYDNISLGDLRTWTKHDTRSSAGLSSRFVFLWCFLLFICLECLCRYVFFFFFFHIFGLALGKIVPMGCVLLCFCAFFLFLARRYALIRDAPDDLYFSPPCFSFCNMKTEKKKRKEQKKFNN